MELQQFINFLRINKVYDEFLKDSNSYPNDYRVKDDGSTLTLEEVWDKIPNRDIIVYMINLGNRNLLGIEKINFWLEIDSMWFHYVDYYQ
jgi:hypothetical protein